MSVTDAERAFYEQVLAASEGSSIADLRYAYFLAALDGGLPASPVEVPEGLTATGAPSVDTYLRGDGAWATPPNTAYFAMTSEEAATGTSTIARIISAKVLADEMTRRLPAPPATGTYRLVSTDGVLSWVAEA